MKPAGLLAVEHAKGDGRWDAAYDSQSNATVPEDLQAALDQNPKARAFFATLDSANRYAILFRSPSSFSGGRSGSAAPRFLAAAMPEAPAKEWGRTLRAT